MAYVESFDSLEVAEKPGGQYTDTAAFGGDHAYVIVPSGAGAVAHACDAGLSTFQDPDPGTVFQRAINALALQNGGTGGKIVFKGQHVLSRQIVLYPGITLAGGGPNANKSIQNSGANLRSTFNGPTLLVTGINGNNGFFPVLRDFSIWGDAASVSQVLVQFDASGGFDVFDAYVNRVTAFDAGSHNWNVATAGKIWMDHIYAEGAVGDNIHITAGTVAVTNSYIFGSTGHGVSFSGAAIYLANNRVWSNAQGSAGIYGLNLQGGSIIVVGNHIQNCGSNGDYQAKFGGNSQPYVMVVGNYWEDTRGVSAVNRHFRFLSQAPFGTVTGNRFVGHKASTPVNVAALSGTQLLIQGNQGLNDAVGALATPFTATGPHIGFDGTGASPSASTTYQNVVTPLFIVSTAGTGVSITITDPAGNTVLSGAATYTGPLPVGYKINFGAFSVAPTLYVGVT